MNAAQWSFSSSGRSISIHLPAVDGSKNPATARSESTGDQLVREHGPRPDQFRAITSEHAEFLGDLGVRQEGAIEGAVGAQQGGQHPSVPQSDFAPATRKRSRWRSTAFGLMAKMVKPCSSRVPTSGPWLVSSATQTSVGLVTCARIAISSRSSPFGVCGTTPDCSVVPASSIRQKTCSVSAQSMPTSSTGSQPLGGSLVVHARHGHSLL